MSRLGVSIWAALIVSCASLSAGYAISSYWQMILIEAGFCVIFGLFEKLKLHWALSLILLAHGILVGFGLRLGFQPIWLFFGLIANLFAWDLYNFNLWLNSYQRVDNQALLERRHIFRLSFVMFAGIILLVFAFLIQLRLSFGMILLLGLLSILCLSQGYHLAQRVER